MDKFAPNLGKILANFKPNLGAIIGSKLINLTQGHLTFLAKKR